MKPIGQNALITGGSRGIGYGYAEGLAKIGCNLVLNFVSDPTIDEKCKELSTKYGIKVFSIKADVSESTQARKMVREAHHLLGGIDIVICNSGICQFTPFMEVTDEIWHKHIGVNLNGTFYVAQEAAKLMIEQKRPSRIIFTTSPAISRSNSGQTHYCTTKAGQNLLMQGMALELGRYGITVNGIAPGWIQTDINSAQSQDKPLVESWIKAHCPLGRLGTIDDMHGVIQFLVSEEASYVSGATYYVDGGWNAQL